LEPFQPDDGAEAFERKGRGLEPPPWKLTSTVPCRPAPHAMHHTAEARSSSAHSFSHKANVMNSFENFSAAISCIFLPNDVGSSPHSVSTAHRTSSHWRSERVPYDRKMLSCSDKFRRWRCL